jgi:Zn-dependent oligopeptidase
MKLDDNGRKSLKAINDKIISYGTQFDRNIAEYKDSLKFNAQQIAGVPEADTKPWKRADGTYSVQVNGPNYLSILENAADPETRKAILVKYNNRAYPANITVLDSLLYYRQKLAITLGFKTYAQYALVQKMAGKPAVVWHFLDDLRDKLSANLQPEIDEINNLKHKMHPELANEPCYGWDNGYYSKKLLDSKYQLNTDEVKQYFEMNSTITGMFNFYQKLLNIRITEVKGLPVWYSKVKSYELFMDGKKMGTFFLDLYPRPNKYTHFETANISLYHRTGNQEILPVGTLICNFPEGSATQPSIMEHGDVITMFHEFGHLIHFLLCHHVIASQNAFATKGDFVEAPSQFMENFCWDYSCLKLFARNYKTGQVLPVELFNKMKRSQLFGITRQYMRQVYFGMIDFTYEDRYDEVKQKGVDQIERDLFSMTRQPYAGTHFICSFGHLNSYGANYYGYLWSKVFAQDIFSVFDKNGVLNQTLGIKYRKTVLEKGATEEETTMLRNFLGRKPNSKAFLTSLGLK